MTNNHFALGTLTATNTAAGYNVNNILDGRPFTKWRADSSGTRYVNIDHGGPNYITSGIAIINHNFFSCGATVTVEYYHDPPGEWVQAHAFTITKDGSIAGNWTAITDGDQWRIKIVTTGANIPEFAVAILSENTVFPVPPDSPHTDFTEASIKESGNSKTGNLLGVVNRGYSNTFSLKFSLLTRVWVDAWIRDWWWPSFGKTGLPFAYIPDYTDDDEEVYLVRSTDDYVFQTPKSIGTYYDSIQFDLVGLRYR
jgi:hypothetical protein